VAKFGTWASDLELAHRLADEAARIALGYFGRAVEHVEKNDGTPVSAADLAVETALVETITRERPHDAVLSEERGGATRSDGRRWIIDPIDGTEPFLTHIALEQEGEVVLAVLTRPAAR
jgi:histidinol-phosphatase